MVQQRSCCPTSGVAPLAVPLLEKSDLEGSTCHRARGIVSRSPLLGLTLVTTAALLFGVVAACVKAIVLPTLVLQLVRSVIEWVLGLAAALVYWRREKIGAGHDAELMRAGGDDSGAASSSCTTNGSSRSSSGAPTDLVGLLLGPSHLRGWLVLRALLYWLFLACWWFALASMPIGDATTIVYVGPVFISSMTSVRSF